ncbi:pseudaminic acid cytidylyltransferase [Maribacter sp. PR1]|uniref:Pseudaminic acid cytidylyltransferase n=1 Tax=Maribacter cobaltidurans TaxID=1178778 RepID=A0ABU7IQF6_9FLAO|nr:MULTISPECIES: pseudaminic acid cytidylyltransferase [Maribacter]MDC6387804.1 pseudaminic acid cytidylyltransferase [Maribacter sp. PR1]MEE1975192.1 pseudaminic acid cytidylyltransferase [Maribacter cobaltidurans]
MANLAIIPARGGSKRIPRKNIREFLGKPIIAYSIEAAINSKLFDEIMVSTDDMEIAKIAEKYGAKVPFIRSSKNSNDFSTTFDVLEEVLLKYLEQRKSFENVCCIYPCAPLTNEEKLKGAFLKLEETGADSVIPIVSFSFPIQRAFKISQGKLNYFHPEHERTRSQSMEKAYHDAGQFYWFKSNRILKLKSLVTKETSYVELSELEVQDIDNESDWKMAELKYRIAKK